MTSRHHRRSGLLGTIPSGLFLCYMIPKAELGSVLYELDLEPETEV